MAMGIANELKKYKLNLDYIEIGYCTCASEWPCAAKPTIPKRGPSPVAFVATTRNVKQSQEVSQ